MRPRVLTTAAVIVGVLVAGLAVGIWNLVDTQEPVQPVQLSP